MKKAKTMQYQSQRGLLLAAVLAIASGLDLLPMHWSGDSLLRNGYTMFNTLIAARLSPGEGQSVGRSEPGVTVKALSLEDHPAAGRSFQDGLQRTGTPDAVVMIAIRR